MRRTWWRHHLTAAFIGFIAGIVFWHTIGFWTFVQAVVMRGPEPGHIRAVSIPQCNEAVLDRASGTLELKSCYPGAPALKQASSRGRSDRLRQVAGRD